MLLSVFAVAGNCADPVYSVMKSIPLTGSGAVDFLTVDESSRRLYVARGTEIVVVDIDSGKQAGAVSGLKGAHGAVAVKHLNKGFATNGGNNSVSVFDLNTLVVTASIPAGTNPDHIIYDPYSKKVFAFNNGSGNVTVIDPVANSVVKTISLGPTPELSVSDGAGHVYIGLAGTATIGVINTTSLTMETTWSIDPDKSAKTLCIDTANHRLFNGGSKNLNVINTLTGKVVATTPNVGSSDGNAFDVDNGILFATGGGGSLFIIKRGAADSYTKLQTLATGGTGTNAYDSKTHCLFMAAGDGKSVKVIGFGMTSNIKSPERPANVVGSNAIHFTGKGVLRFRIGLPGNHFSDALGKKL
jgi:YVTN family beta-propeller protein